MSHFDFQVFLSQLLKKGFTFYFMKYYAFLGTSKGYGMSHFNGYTTHHWCTPSLINYRLKGKLGGFCKGASRTYKVVASLITFFVVLKRRCHGSKLGPWYLR